MMKYLKTYNKLNEGLKDKMISKTDKDVIFDLLSNNDKYRALRKSLMEEYMPAIKYILKGDDISNDRKYKDMFVTYMPYLKKPENVKYLLDNKDIRNFFNNDQLYILEKFYFGMHKDKTIVYEELVDEFMEDVVLEDVKDFELKYIDGKINNIDIFKYVERDKLLIYNKGRLIRYFNKWHKLDAFDTPYKELLLAISFSKFFNKVIKNVIKLNYI